MTASPLVPEGTRFDPWATFPGSTRFCHVLEIKGPSSDTQHRFWKFAQEHGLRRANSWNAELAQCHFDAEADFYLVYRREPGIPIEAHFSDPADFLAASIFFS